MSCLAFSLMGCASVQSAVELATSSATNPISLNQLAAAEASYGAVLSVAVRYRNLPLCHTGENELSGSALCARRSVIVKIQQANKYAHAAILTARNFVRQHPNLDASAVISTAVNAVANFRAVVPAVGGN